MPENPKKFAHINRNYLQLLAAAELGELLAPPLPLVKRAVVVVVVVDTVGKFIVVDRAFAVVDSVFVLVVVGLLAF